jgi:hypothetical protein
MAASRPFLRSFGSVGAVAALFLAGAGTGGLGAGCSSSDACDSSACLAGNQCIDDGSGTLQCRLVCTSQSDCPANYHCTPDASHKLDFCAADHATYAPGAGTWGASCSPSGGIEGNPDCDSSQGFACYAQSPTDGSAYCTLFNCASDADCRGGWWCATVNQGPNATTASRTMGMTETVCQPRAYCAPCASDVDCWSPNGPPARCIQDGNGQSYCTVECASDSNCHLEASCLALDLGSAPVVAELSTSPATTIHGSSNDVWVGDAVTVARHLSSGSINVAGRAYPGTGEALTVQLEMNKSPIAGAVVRFDSSQLSLHDIPIPSLAGVALAPGDRIDCLLTYTRGVEPPHPPLPIPTDGLVGTSLKVTVQATLDGATSGLCVPRAGVCVGDGALCAPCRSDADCSNGLCVPATNSTERFCSATPSARCTSTTSTANLCPSTDEASVPVACTTAAQGGLPASQCVGIVSDGFDSETGTVSYVAGCYTPNR